MTTVGTYLVIIWGAVLIAESTSWPPVVLGSILAFGGIAVDLMRSSR